MISKSEGGRGVGALVKGGVGWVGIKEDGGGGD